MGVRWGCTALLFGLASCQPSLPECSIVTAAQDVVFLTDGTPMYAGQALLTVSCASGVCHDSDASERARNGAPAGLDFNLYPACTVDDTDCETTRADALDALRERLRVVAKYRHDILGGLHEDLGRVPVYREFEFGRFSDPLPEITSDEGRAIVGLWLGCGAQVIEVARVSTSLFEVPGSRCDDAADGRSCAFAAGLRVPEPTWSGENGIYERVIVELGCLSCHRPGEWNFGPDDQELDLCGATVREPGIDDCDPAVVLESLLNQPAVGYACGTGEAGMMISSDPTTSFFYSKLTETPPCGEPMPGIADDQVLAVIREWIQDGARL